MRGNFSQDSADPYFPTPRYIFGLGEISTRLTVKQLITGLPSTLSDIALGNTDNIL